MKTKFAAIVLWFATLGFSTSTVIAQGTLFSYQGQLTAATGPANGTYNMTFQLWNAGTGGAQVGSTMTTNGIIVTNGLFMVYLDFGNQYSAGTSYWLQLAVETNGGAIFSSLSPRQELTPTPYAIYAEGANAAGLSGTIPMSSLSGTYSGVVSLTNPGDSFSGNGGGLTNVNARLLGGLASSNFWQSAGNAGTTPGANFVGTTDVQPLEFHVNGLRALRLEPGVGTNYAPNVIGGSPSNSVSSGAIGATIAGGGEANLYGLSLPNTVATNFGTIGGGTFNNVKGQYSTVGGGQGNYASGEAATIGGGWDNAVEADDGTVGGGYNNHAIGQYAIAGGGFGNDAGGDYAAVGGGYQNYATGAGSFIGGGGYDGTTTAGNQSSSSATVVCGGLGNNAYASYSVIGGGYYNTNSGPVATVAGGELNTVSGYGSTAGGGVFNSVGGDEATVPGGYANVASGYASFAAGTYAQADNDDCFVWSDGSSTFTSTAVDQFLIQATGGVGINTASPEQNLSINGGIDIDQGNNNNGGAFNNGTPGGYGLTFGSGSGEGIGSERTSGANQYDLAFYTAFVNRITILNNGNVGIGTSSPINPLQMGSGAYCSAAGNWTSVSDRNAKSHFTGINPREVLDKVSAMPVTEWQYKTEPDGMWHIGPMAQDFHAAFGLNGADDKHISVVDEGGVALAAIQGLDQKLDEKDTEIQNLKQQNESLEKRLAELEQAVKSITQNQ